MCTNPYAKTKVLRFTNSFTFINKLAIPIIVRCAKSLVEKRVEPNQQTIVDFAYENSSK